MKKIKKKLSKQEKARRKEYQLIFINGKQVRVKKPETINEMLAEEFIKENADSAWLHQNEMWEYIEDEVEW